MYEKTTNNTQPSMFSILIHNLKYRVFLGLMVKMLHILDCDSVTEFRFHCCSSIEEVLSVLPYYLESIDILPANLKDRFLHLMTKRGLASDENISQVS